ncbi:hypothetical protein [Nisaea sediminum]|uniref:hypothetical protein n=1 Tax=Nisaea sediminum TaxID=2775867 RepID=UPI001868BBF1|nr:hypothetical protein [Nisaea sediminum]
MDSILSEDFYERLELAIEGQGKRIIEASRLALDWMPLASVLDLPGFRIYERVAIRMSNGDTLYEAAAGEYCLRWRLALRNPGNPSFRPPHLLGM